MYIWVVPLPTRGLFRRQICFASRPCWSLAPQDVCPDIYLGASFNQLHWRSKQRVVCWHIYTWVVSRPTRGVSRRQISSKQQGRLAKQIGRQESPLVGRETIHIYTSNNHCPNEWRCLAPLRNRTVGNIYIYMSRDFISTLKVSSVQLVKWSP